MASNRELLGAPYDSAAFIKLETIVASNDSSLDFTTGFDGSKYLCYRLFVSGLIPATDNVSLKMLLSSDGGSTWLTTSTDMQRGHFYGTATSLSTTTNTDVRITNNVGNASDKETGIFGTIDIYNFEAAVYTSILGNVGYRSGGDNQTIFLTNNTHKTNTAMNAFQLSMVSGNITSGTATLFGIPK
jgi:hypothetical protein